MHRMSVRPSSVVNELPVKAPPPSRLRQVLAAGVAEKQAQESKPILTTGVPTSSAVSDTYEEVWKVLEALKEKAGGAVSNDKELDNLRKSVKDALESLKDPDTVDRLKQDILTEGGKVNRLEGDLYEKNILIQNVLQQLRTANALQKKMERDVGELQKELAEKKLRVTNLVNDLHSVENTMKTLRNNLVQERITIKQKQETLDTLSAKERELTKELKGAKDELATTQEGLSKQIGELQQQVDEQNEVIIDLKAQLKRMRRSTATVAIPAKLASMITEFAETSARNGFNDLSVISRWLTKESANRSDVIELASIALRGARNLRDQLAPEDLQRVDGLGMLVFDPQNALGVKQGFRLLKDDGVVTANEVEQQNPQQLIDVTKAAVDKLNSVPAEVRKGWLQNISGGVIEYLFSMFLFLAAMTILAFLSPELVPVEELMAATDYSWIIALGNALMRLKAG